MSEKSPLPQGKYLAAKRFGNLIVTAGMTPRREGTLLETGKIKRDVNVEQYRQAVVQAAKNALTAAETLLKEGEEIEGILSMTCYIQAEENYIHHAKLADLASEYYIQRLGSDGIGARAAIGVSTLPGNAPVEIQLMVTVKK